jgi:5'-nucleotidase
MFLTEGAAHVAKADANGITIYKHLIYQNSENRLTVSSELVRMDEKIPFKESVAQLVSTWENAVYNSFRELGLEPTRNVCNITDVLNGMEVSIRYSQNNLGAVVTDALTMNSNADMGMINSGSIRIDDNVTGEISELDVIRIMPFGNKVYEVTLKGTLLKNIITSNDQRKGFGGYLQMDKRVSVNNGKAFINGSEIESYRDYKVRTTEFLISGKEQKLEYFNEKNPDVIKVEAVRDAKNENLDLRMNFINELKRLYIK